LFGWLREKAKPYGGRCFFGSPLKGWMALEGKGTGNGTNHLEAENMNSGGGGASGDTTYNWNPSMQPRWDNLLNLTERSLFPARRRSDSYPDPRASSSPTPASGLPGPSYNELQAIANSSSMAQVAPSPFSYGNTVGNYNLAADQTGQTLKGQYLNADPYAKARLIPGPARIRRLSATLGRTPIPLSSATSMPAPPPPRLP
jgi:hypothetical protein